ncbi:sigma-70 family RNA polymerase sigma factor [Paenisporosarcina indica]|uniref:sigma-70 family RNA polymerase sigma factor n=1 Tax=Paenisporosarcina indica TaxID=650093 RepID=UPI0009501BFE|nr:sigma-70 family RNA polymerase sigma factor [Paenisporosarcina indica]
MGDLEIIKKAIDGDDEAFITIMKEHKDTLYRTALAFLKNEHDAIEAVQEITYRAYKKIHTLKEPNYIKTWLTRIMMNYCQDQIKKNKRIVIDERLSDSLVTNDRSQLEITEALSTLSDAEQQLIHLKYFQDVKIKDIAILENIPEGTVKSRLHKIMKTLRQYFNEKGEVDHV